ncbi:MAG: flavin reductase family protein [Pseudomonadota bacterium]
MARRDATALERDFLGAMRRLASTVTVVTTGDGSRQAGLTATAVCSLSVAPPSLLACVNRGAGAHDIIARTRRFAVNILAAQQTDLALLFADPLRASQRFAKAAWLPSGDGVPIIDGAVATLVCRLDQAVEAFTHTIFIGLVEEVQLSERDSLLYGDGRFGRFGPPEQGGPQG